MASRFESRIAPDGNEIFIDVDEKTQGVEGSFYPAYEDPGRRYGWFCSSCGSVDTVMDPMGRIECTECTNERTPTRWDACYL